MGKSDHCDDWTVKRPVCGLYGGNGLEWAGDR